MDLTTAQARLQLWLDCEEALATAQEYKLETPSGMQQLKRADLPEVRKQINYWQAVVNQLKGKKRKRFSTARFNTPT